MKRAIEILKMPRLMVLENIEHLNIEQLNKVPEGFKNNIAWNLGHMVAAQEGIFYRRSGLDMHITSEFFEAYKPGTKPEKWITAEGFETIKELLFSTLEQIDKDLDTDIFKDYGSFVTRYGIELGNIDDGVAFIPFHDGFHIGYVMSIMKLV
jgi:hypothetical protein